jgi:alkanesulfonate monooxygenase
MQLGLHVPDFTWPGGPEQLGRDGENVDSLLEQMRALAALGISHVHGRLPQVSTITPLELLGERVIPVAARF